MLYTARTHTTGGRANGAARSYDGHLEIKLSTRGTPDMSLFQGHPR